MPRLAPCLFTAAALVLGGATAAPARADAGPARGLRTVVSVAAERIVLADRVAAAKYGTPAPIDDPARERQILDDVGRRAAGLGVDPGWARAVFRDQIEANKQVQRGLYARWAAHPEERPAHRPDLAKEVRPALDRVTTRLLDALRVAAPARRSPSCVPRVAAAATAPRGFDGLHGAALARAVTSICGQDLPAEAAGHAGPGADLPGRGHGARQAR